MAVSDMMKKFYFMFTLTPIKKVHAFQKFMFVLITFVAINNEMLKKDFASKYFLEVKAVEIRTKPLLIICC